MKAHRATAQEGISRLTKTNLNNLSRVSGIGDGPSQELVARAQHMLAMEIPQQPLPGLDILSGIPAPAQLHLHGFPGLQTDRYVREFVELGLVGQGGYGKVFKAKHNLDGSFYAVKRIPVSPAKLTRIQENGPQELETMLEEIRSLARFDHANVVRYHNAWLEFTSDNSITPAVNIVRADRLLEDATASFTDPAIAKVLPSRLSDLALGDSQERLSYGYGPDIVFGTSDTGTDGEERNSEPDSSSINETLKHFRRKNRQGSQGTLATISSLRSRMSAVEDVDEDDDEVEVIPRTHMPSSQESLSGFSESMLSHSDMPGHLMRTHSSGPVLVLNVQMSLCETNLASFLSNERCSHILHPIDGHCFHPGFSMELLSNIVAGVQYLHAQGIVHRDLKPANVFLSLSDARHPPHGSVNISTCKLCPKRDCLHITPRIGDFGLAAALDNTSVSTKPVGTEFYRPQAGSGTISDKLDVFALGIVGFETLHHFSTRMERVATLNELRRGTFPDGFMAGFGDARHSIQRLISAMIEQDEQQRLNCDQVKAEVDKLVHILGII